MTIQKMRSKFPFSRRVTWSRWVSDVVSPPVVWAVLVIPVAIHYSQTAVNAIFWATLYSLFICLLPLLYISINVWRGNIGDIHMKDRRERLRPLLVTIISTALLWWLLKQLDAPPAFPLLALLSLVQISVIAAITLSWQISMHMMSISGAVVAVAIVFSVGAALMIVPLVPLVAAARLHLKRHTPAQIIAGTLVGALVPVLLLGLLPVTVLQAL